MSGENLGPNVSGYLDPTGRNFELVVYQSGRAVLDKELNLSSVIATGQSEADLRRDLPSGWLSDDFLNASPNTLPIFVSSPGSNTLVLTGNLTAHVNGWLLNVSNTGTSATNTISLPLPPVASTRTDILFLEVWKMLISPAPSTVGKSPTGRIWDSGNVKNDPAHDATLNHLDDIKDTTLGVESTKRVQIQYRLRVVSGVDLFSFPYGLDDPAVVANKVPPNAGTPDGGSTSYPYVNQSANGDAGLWVAGDGNPGNTLGTVDGFMYAIPFLAVFRRNSAAFSPTTNMNGAGAAFGGTSDRPDGLFNDAFVSDDIADLRMAVSPTGWDYQEVLDKNITYLLDNALRSEWMSTSQGVQGHTPLYWNQIGGTQLGSGPLVGQFDAVCRTFSGRAIYETVVVALPAPSPGGWTSNSTYNIDPTSLPVYPYSGHDWDHDAPTEAQIVDVLSANWVGTTTVAYGALKSGRIKSITGLGTKMVAINFGTIPAVTQEPLYVELLIAYPPGPLGIGHGLTATPTADFQATATTFQVNSSIAALEASPYNFQSSLFTTVGSATYFNPTPSLASLDWTHREATLTYTTTSLTTPHMMADTETVGATFFMMPERILTASSPTVLRQVGGTGPFNPLVGGVVLDPTGRFVTFTNAADYTSPGDVLTVTYKAVRPFPDSNSASGLGEQVTIFFNTRAPQASRAVSPSYLTSLSVVPKFIPKTLYSLTSGVASPDVGYSLPNAYVQTGGVLPFTGSSPGEYGLSAEANISVSDFNADTGLLMLPTYVPFVPDPDALTFSSPSVDFEKRTFFSSTSPSGVYLPNAFAQDLSDPKSHKNFLPFLAELVVDSPPLGFKGQLVLVMLIRWAENDEMNGVYFGSGSTTSSSVFRLRNNMLNKKAGT